MSQTTEVVSLQPHPPPPLPPPQPFPPPQQPLPPPQYSSSECERHPGEQYTGFCPSCLCERLAGLEQSSFRKTTTAATAATAAATTASSSNAVAALKAILRGGLGQNLGEKGGACGSKSTSSSSRFSELRRSKSFSTAKAEVFPLVFEPQRRSCDVRGRSTLWSLFNQDGERKNPRSGTTIVEAEDKSRVSESRQQREEDGGIRVSEDAREEESEIKELKNLQELRSMKEHIDLDSQCKKPPGRDLREIAGSFWWSAASVFSKKLQNWRRKQKLKKRDLSSMRPAEKRSTGRNYGETQSEIADYDGFGRRSCDIDPRFSLDANRMSLDDSRYSLDEPRASWDGYLVGRTLARLPPMVEDAPLGRTDNQIPVEAQQVREDGAVPGGQAQTRDYYSDSSSRRKKSLDRSTSIRKTAAAVVAEMDEIKPVSNGKSPPTTADTSNYGPRLSSVTDRDSRESISNQNSMKDECSDCLEPGVCRDGGVFPGEKKTGKKISRWKAWNLWGLIYRRAGGGGFKGEDDEICGRANGVERSLSESWEVLRRRNGAADFRGVLGRNGLRCNSSVSSRNSFSSGGGVFVSGRRSSADVDCIGRNKAEFLFERNRSARCIPNEGDNGVLRLYMTPQRGSGRRVSVKSQANNAHSIARSVLRLY